MNNKVSVITASYNCAKFIEESIKSVLNQTYDNLELIIVDDCSTDNTEEIVNEYIKKDSRIKFYRLNNNSGAAVARNKGLDEATGRFIAFLDSDDIWDKQKLEKQINFMQTNNYGFSFTSYRLIDENGGLLNKEIRVPNEITYKKLLKNTIIGCLTVIIDKELIGDFKMPLVRAGQDTATWLSILRNGNIAYGYDEVLASYRMVKGSISSNKLKALKRTWNTYRNLENLNLIKSSYYFTHYVLNSIKKRL